MEKIKYLLILLCLTFLMIHNMSKPLTADIYDTFGNGSRGIAMGGAQCASTHSLESLYYNPAGLGKSNYNTIRLSYLYSHPMLEVNGTNAGLFNNKNITMGMIFIDFGLSVNEIIKKLPIQTTIGVGMSVLHDMKITSIDDLDESSFQYIRFGSPIKRSAIYFALGFEVVPSWLWLGVGAHAMVIGDSTVNLDMDASTFNTHENVVPNQQSVHMDMQIDVNPTCGIIFSPLKGLNLAFSYKNDIEANFDPFIANILINVGATQAIVSAYTAVLLFYNPDIFRFGISYEIAGMTIEFDTSLEKWSSFHLSAPREAKRTIPDFKDVFIYHGGLEYKISIFSFRLGYQYAETPVPDQAATSNIVDCNRHIISGGIELKLNAPSRFLDHPFKLGFAIQDQILEKRNVNNYSVKGHMLTAHFSFELKFGSILPGGYKIGNKKVSSTSRGSVEEKVNKNKKMLNLKKNNE